MIDDMRPSPRRAPAPGPEPTPQLARRPMPAYQPRPFASTQQFRTPEQTAAQDGQDVEEEITMDDEPTPGSEIGTGQPQKPHRSLKAWLKSRTKKQWVVIILVALLLVGGLGAGAYALFFKSTAAPVVKTIKKKTPVVTKKPTTVASTLTGLQVAPEVNKRPITAVMIENSLDARPQSGIDQAGVVFEAVAEGGITRFCNLFQDTEPAYIGPVRSVRPYYIQWAVGFDAAIAHVGGSGEALQDMKDWNVKDLDQFSNGNYFQRIASRAAPHNVYTSMSQLREIENRKGYGVPNFTPLARKKEQPSKTPNATSIDVDISGPYFNSHYDYDAATNSYKRSQAGQPHMQVDQTGAQTQIAPKVVVALVMSQGIASDGTHTAYGALGTGQAYIFQDGTATQVTWKKSTRQENFTFTDNTGKAVQLNPGQTWFVAVGDASRVTYK